MTVRISSAVSKSVISVDFFILLLCEMVVVNTTCNLPDNVSATGQLGLKR